MITLSTEKQPSSLQLGLRILCAIVLTEATIMASFDLLGVDGDSLFAGAVDTSLLALISTIVIYHWVISPLKKAKQKNEMFSALVSHTDVGMVVTDPHAGDVIVYVNPAFSKITGYPADEAIGRNPRFLQGDDVDPAALEASRNALREGRSARVVQRNRRKDGSLFWNDLHLNPVLDDRGGIQAWVGLVNDITSQRELERQNANWASAMRQSDEAVCVFNEQGIVEFANDSFCKNVGMPLDDVTGLDIRSFCVDDEISIKLISESMQAKRSHSGRHRCLRGDGSSYEALSSMTPIEQPDGQLAFVAVHRDITDMAAVEAQLRQAQKMEAVGMLVGGIAHDFNNVLAGILGNLYMIRRHLQGEPKMQKRIEAVEKQGYAAAGMVRQLLSFSRRGVVEVKIVDLVPFVHELIEFSRVSVPASIELVGQLTVKHCLIHCDSVQLQQSLLNLIINATHAVTERGVSGGRIEVCVDTEPPANSAIAAGHAFWARIRVRDNGVGMNEETRNRIFEPFFTTRVSGVGSGLGLAMVQGYIEALEGVIEVETAPGEGTIFSICLPAENVKLEALGDSKQSLRQGHGELVLLADDDPLVLQALTEILESAHYKVLAAKNGEEAFQLLESHGQHVQMAILDVVMPKGSGVDVARKIEACYGDVSVVFMTGYDRQNVLPKDDDGTRLMLQKPWDLTQLNAVLEQSLRPQA